MLHIQFPARIVSSRTDHWTWLTAPQGLLPTRVPPLEFWRQRHLLGPHHSAVCSENSASAFTSTTTTFLMTWLGLRPFARSGSLSYSDNLFLPPDHEQVSHMLPAEFLLPWLHSHCALPAYWHTHNFIFEPLLRLWLNIDITAGSLPCLYDWSTSLKELFSHRLPHLLNRYSTKLWSFSHLPCTTDKYMNP